MLKIYVPSPVMLKFVYIKFEVESARRDDMEKIRCGQCINKLKSLAGAEVAQPNIFHLLVIQLFCLLLKIYVDMEDRRESTASQEMFISLQQLEPSPIESPSSDAAPEKQLPDLPPPHSLGLSGSGHGVAYYCTSPPFRSIERFEC